MYREKYTFSNDWFDYNTDLWAAKFAELKSRENHALEIGSFEGASTTWLLDVLANDANSTVTAVDTFDASLLPDGTVSVEEMSDLERRFRANVEKSNNFDKLRIRKGLSRYVLRSMANEFDSHFNFVYIDGSHRARDVLDDAVMTWPMLQDGGFMVFDDYRWHKYAEDYDNPKIAIDGFTSCYATELDILHRDFQVIVQKHPRTAPSVPSSDSGAVVIRDLDE